MARFEEIIRLFSSTSTLLPITTWKLSVAAEDQALRTTYKRETLWISRASLDKEFISPAVEGLETLGVVHVVNQYAAVGSSVKCDTQRLKPFLTCSIPDLFTKKAPVLAPVSFSVGLLGNLPASSPVGRPPEPPLSENRPRLSPCS